MAFSKFANASVVKPVTSADAWCNLRTAAMQSAGKVSDMRAAKVVLDRVDPGKFLLSHCTIIASVDTDVQSGVKLGRQMVDGFQIDRKYADYYIKPGTSQYVNNNHDAWERKLLLACYKSFIGGENYVEHIQIPEMSKGKILDAAARNIGDSIYVDILVATDRKHQALIKAITSGQLGTLSMGCSVDFTICSKCGNVAEDETQLCTHIRYFKGSDFIDEMGQTRKIAELCGHINAEPGSVKFIEGSWVANPAFKGAVLRNILTPAEIEGLSGNMSIAAALSAPTRIPEADAMMRAARSLLRAQGQGDEDFDMGDFDMGQGGSAQDQGQGQAAPEPKEESGIGGIVDELVTDVHDKVKDRVKREINQGEADEVQGILDENASNESLIKSALQHPQWRKIARFVEAKAGRQKSRQLFLGLILHKKGGWKAVKAAKQFSGSDILALSRVIDVMKKRSSIAGEARIYRTVLAVGGTGPYEDVETYLAACRQVLGRSVTGSEAGALLEKGKLYALGS